MHVTFPHNSVTDMNILVRCICQHWYHWFQSLWLSCRNFMYSGSSDNNMYKKKLLMLIHSKLHLKSCAFWYLYTNASLPSGCENIIQHKLECSSCKNVTHYYTVVLIKLLNQGSFLPITVLYKTLISQGQSSFIVKWLS